MFTSNREGERERKREENGFDYYRYLGIFWFFFIYFWFSSLKRSCCWRWYWWLSGNQKKKKKSLVFFKPKEGECFFCFWKKIWPNLKTIITNFTQKRNIEPAWSGCYMTCTGDSFDRVQDWPVLTSDWWSVRRNSSTNFDFKIF